jgi:hypothetical protein
VGGRHVVLYIEARLESVSALLVRSAEVVTAWRMVALAASAPVAFGTHKRRHWYRMKRSLRLNAGYQIGKSRHDVGGKVKRTSWRFYEKLFLLVCASS